MSKIISRLGNAFRKICALILIGFRSAEDISGKVTDISGIELKPGEPDVCLGIGEMGYECCCDECDCFLRCFPEYTLENEE